MQEGYVVAVLGMIFLTCMLTAWFTTFPDQIAEAITAESEAYWCPCSI
jgi:hypothetical protein